MSDNRFNFFARVCSGRACLYKHTSKNHLFCFFLFATLLKPLSGGYQIFYNLPLLWVGFYVPPIFLQKNERKSNLFGSTYVHSGAPKKDSPFGLSFFVCFVYLDGPRPDSAHLAITQIR